MSEKGSIQRGKKWAFMMTLGEKLKEEVLESMSKNPAMKADYDNYMNSIGSKKKK